MKRFLMLLPLLAILAACQSLGIPQPQTFQEKVDYAYGIHAAVLETEAAGLESRQITDAEGLQVLKIADGAQSLLDSATAVAATNPTGANAKLAAATKTLLELQQLLRSYGVTK
jgi:hypothetical protein